MPRFLHTADWQLGLRLNFVPGDAGARLRAQRFDVVERIASVADDEQVDVVLVAGDVFDDNGVGAETLQQARDALAHFRVPVVLLPGNHDPATEDSALARLGDLGPNCHVALTDEPIPIGELEILPCPLRHRHEYEDPTLCLGERSDAHRVRVALAHGGVRAFSDAADTPNLIDPAVARARSVDYLALGDWHGVYQYDARTWYSGAPEATRFKEKRPGHVLLVDIDGPGAEPRVREIQVARTHWEQQDFEFADDGDLGRMEAWFADLDAPSRTLVELTLTGVLSLGARARLDQMLADFGERLALLRVAAETIHSRPSDADLEALSGEGFVAAALATLRTGEDPSDDAALRLLYRLLTGDGG